MTRTTWRSRMTRTTCRSQVEEGITTTTTKVEEVGSSTINFRLVFFIFNLDYYVQKKF